LNMRPKGEEAGTFKFTAQLNSQKRHMILTTNGEEQLGWTVTNPSIPDRQYVGLAIPSHQLQALSVAVNKQ